MISRRIAFARIADAARSHAPGLVSRWLPDGRKVGREWIALNPKRGDRRYGSFRVNLESGRWSDFALGERGGDLISLAAYLYSLSQAEAALRLADSLGVHPYD